MTRRPPKPAPGCCRCGSEASVKPHPSVPGKQVCTNAKGCRQRVARRDLKQRRTL